MLLMQKHLLYCYEGCLLYEEYDELEKEGFIYTVAAKGCFVAAMNLELVKEQNLQKIEEHLREAVRLAEISGVEKTDVEEMLQLVYEENP